MNNYSTSGDVHIGTWILFLSTEGIFLLFLMPFVVHVGAERRSSLDQFHAMIPQNMIYSADQIRLSNTVGQGTLGFMLM